MSDTPAPPIPPPPAAQTSPPPASPPTPPQSGGDEDRSALNQEAQRHRQEAQRLREETAWLQNLTPTQQQFTQQVADALASGNGELAAQLMARLNAAMGRGAPPPPQGYAPPPPPQPVWNGYEWELPPAPTPGYAPQPQYQPQYQPQPNDLWGPPQDDQVIDIQTVQQMVAEALAEERENQRLTMQYIAQIDAKRAELGVSKDSAIDYAARTLAHAESERLQNMGMPHRPIADLYAEQVQKVRDELTPSNQNGGPGLVPPPGATPTPQSNPPQTKQDRLAMATEIVARRGNLNPS